MQRNIYTCTYITLSPSIYLFKLKKKKTARLLYRARDGGVSGSDDGSKSTATERWKVGRWEWELWRAETGGFGVWRWWELCHHRHVSSQQRYIKKVFREKETAGEQKRFKTKKSCLERKIRKAYVCMRNWWEWKERRGLMVWRERSRSVEVELWMIWNISIRPCKWHM